ncbi:MAG: 4Fe-4S dicluster domain-containing protein [candidate division WOR-3 bacterium]
MLTSEAAPETRDLLEQVQELSGQKISDCYQCGECTSGCPVSEQMDPVPSKAIRMLQLGMVQEVLASRGIWQCASCMVCGARCPRGVDYGKISDALRALVLRNKKAHIEPDRVSPELLTDAPQQAFVAAFRKFVL